MPGEVGVYYVDAEESSSVKLRRMELKDDGKLKGNGRMVFLMKI